MKSDKLILNCWKSLALKVITQAIKDTTYEKFNGREIPSKTRKDARRFLSSVWCEQLATFCDNENEVKKQLKA